MSGAMESRAAVFTSRPQDVEVYSAGEWLPGALLGWRHDASGGCQVWVRLTVDGAEEPAWIDLECLRLPERHLAIAPAPAADQGEGSVGDPAATRSLRLAAISATGPARRGRPAAPAAARAAAARPELTVTRAMPAVREDAASRASHPAGRRRADRRIVGETAEFPAVGSSPGRHRAPASSSGAGRHRAADTGVWPAVREPASDGRPPAAQAAEARGNGAEERWPGRAPEPDLLTRPMRLADAVRQSRGARRDDSRGGV